MAVHTSLGVAIPPHTCFHPPHTCLCPPPQIPPHLSLYTPSNLPFHIRVLNLTWNLFKPPSPSHGPRKMLRMSFCFRLIKFIIRLITLMCKYQHECEACFVLFFED